MFEKEIKYWSELHSGVKDLAYRIWHWTYYQTFHDVLEYIEQKAPSTNGLSLEIDRMPLLLRHMIDTMRLDEDEHVRPEQDMFINTDILGDYTDLQKWQNYGYKMGRSKRNYPERYETWVKIFNGERVVDDNGNIVTYESIIKDRMRYSPLSVVPYWIIWNNGSRFSNRDGYPSYPGLHFIEFGKKRLKRRSAAMKGVLATKFARLLLGGAGTDYDSYTYNIPSLNNRDWRESYEAWRKVV